MKQGIVWVLGLTLLATFTPGIVEVVNAGSATQPFSYTGAPQSWTVPSGTTSVVVQILGASGGIQSGIVKNGLGESITATMSVTPGETLYMYVGQQGGTAYGVTAPGPTFGGGGSGAPHAGAGGGASDIRTSADTATQIIVAGGGGGSGSYYGGSAGLVNGADAVGNLGYGQTGGFGGSQVAGGNGGGAESGYSAVGGSPGGRGYGGAGDITAAGGGGGGGGYYGGGGGGGGGNATGGGGGSSYVGSARISNVMSAVASTSSAGFISVTYTVKTYPSISLGLAGGGVNATYRTAIQLQATVAAAGFVRFYYQGKTIGTCQHVAVSGSTASCNWKPAIHGVVLVTANFTPADSSSYYPVSAGPLYVSTVPRATTR